jgi:hypothetical protein
VPFDHVQSLVYLGTTTLIYTYTYTNEYSNTGNNKLLVYKDLAFIINTVTNTYESYTTTLDKMIPDNCREDYEMSAVGMTSVGMAGYINCYTMNTDASIKFKLN